MVTTPTALDGLFDFFSPWRAEAACKGLGHERFFPKKGVGEDSTQSEGKAICAKCPVLMECLEDALVHNDQDGLWGGAGEAERRYLRKGWLRRKHGPGVVAGCSCTWCTDLRRHLRRLDGVKPAVRNRNGKGATHGLRITYNRGCRCAPCRWSASNAGQLVARCGEQTSEWWSMWVPVEADNLERWLAADAAACELLVDVMVGWSVLVGVERDAALASARTWLEGWLSVTYSRRPAGWAA